MGAQTKAIKGGTTQQNTKYEFIKTIWKEEQMRGDLTKACNEYFSTINIANTRSWILDWFLYNVNSMDDNVLTIKRSYWNARRWVYSNGIIKISTIC